MTNGLLPRAGNASDRLVVQTSLFHWSFFLHSAHEAPVIIHRALPPSWPSRSLPSFQLFPVLLRGIGATACRFGGFRVTNGLLPRNKSESERLVLQTSLAHWSFFFHSAQELSGIIHRALPSCSPSRSRSSFRTFSRVVAGGRGHFLSFRRILGDH